VVDDRDMRCDRIEAGISSLISVGRVPEEMSEGSNSESMKRMSDWSEADVEYWLEVYMADMSAGSLQSIRPRQWAISEHG